MTYLISFTYFSKIVRFWNLESCGSYIFMVLLVIQHVAILGLKILFCIMSLEMATGLLVRFEQNSGRHGRNSQIGALFLFHKENRGIMRF